MSITLTEIQEMYPDGVFINRSMEGSESKKRGVYGRRSSLNIGCVLLSFETLIRLCCVLLTSFSVAPTKLQEGSAIGPVIRLNVEVLVLMNIGFSSYCLSMKSIKSC